MVAKHWQFSAKTFFFGLHLILWRKHCTFRVKTFFFFFDVIQFRRRKYIISTKVGQGCKRVSPCKILQFKYCWCAIHKSYQQVSELAFRILLPFATKYLCESGFSALVHIKTNARNRRKVEDDMRLALSNAKLRIPKLALQLRSQPSH